MTDIRPVDTSELDQLARLWHEGWHDAHAAFAPPPIVRARTLENFRSRLAAALPDSFAAGPAGAPHGLVTLKDDELNQFYVAREVRGSGFAAGLMAGAEAELARRGVATAWLACGIGNSRAARFYDKCGWRNVRTAQNMIETPEGVFEIAIWRYEKAMRRP